jgi:ABC-type sugar transport system ATPase subunit
VSTTFALEGRGLSKRFGGVTALDSVDLSIPAGAVTALLGANGAGKSTLVACMSGARRPDAGALLRSGVPIQLGSPDDARRASIVVVHQEPQMLEQQSVATNIYLGRLARRSGAITDHRQVERDAARHLADLGIEDLDPSRAMRTVGGAQRQLVEIARALVDEPAVLFRDEPNATLGEEETARLFQVIDRLRGRGVGIVFISHRLREVYRIADRVVVMRDGHKVAEGTAAELPLQRAMEAIVGPGRPRAEGHGDGLSRAPVLGGTSSAVDDASAPTGIPVLELDHLWGPGFRDVSMRVMPGEIVGMAGLVGSGRTEIAHAVIGATRATHGIARVDGRAVRYRDPSEAVRGGVMFVPEGRRDAVYYGQSVDFNVRSGMWGRLAAGASRPRRGTATERVRSLLASLAVKADGPSVLASTLSGGNQQKLLFGRALAARPRLLILDEPTHGVDVATKREIHLLVRELAGQGLAVWFISSEADEVAELASRIIVIRTGEVAGVFPGGTSVEVILAAGFGEGIASHVH